MKKRISLVLIICLTLLLTSCGNLTNKYIEMPNGVDITVSEEFIPHMANPDNLPIIHFDYNGVRISDMSTAARAIFVQNDQYELSEKFKAHLSQYSPEQIVVTRSVEREKDRKGAKLGSDTLPLDEGTTSLEEIIVVNLSDGTRVSYSYRTFVSGGVRYYAYSYTENMSISLEMPFMVIEKDNTHKLILLPLPYNTKYIVGGTNIELDALLEKDEYLHSTSELYYVFNYPTYLQDQNTDRSFLEEEVRQWYISHCNGQMVNGALQIEYLGFKFIVDFNQEKLNQTTSNVEPAFKLIYIE